MGFLMLTPLGCISLLGLLWVGTVLPETSRNLFGSVLAADLLRAFGYGLGLGIPASVVLTWLRGSQNRLWRGVALAITVAAGHGLLAGLTLALDRTLGWPGLPDGLPPLVSLLYAVAIVLAWRSYFL